VAEETGERETEGTIGFRSVRSLERKEWKEIRIRGKDYV